MQSHDELYALTSVTDGDRVPGNLSVSTTCPAHSSEDVVATFELSSPSPTAGSSNAPFGGERGAIDASAQLQNISLTDDPDETVFASSQQVAQQQGSSAGSATVSNAGSVVSTPAQSLAGSRNADAPATVPAHPEHILPPTMSGPLHAQDIPVKVWVKDPEKVERSGMGVLLGGYVSYLVRTESSLGVFGEGMPTTPSAPAAAEASAASSTATDAQLGSAGTVKPSSREGVHVWEVRRRFADFEELHRLLKRHFRGYFLPPLPDKSFLDTGLGGDSFQKMRKIDLQAYMCTIANHPAIQTSQELLQFLTYPESLNACQQWQQMVQRPAPADALLGLLRADHKQQLQTAGSSGLGSSSSGNIADAPASGKLGGMMWRVRHSIKNVVQPKAPAELPVEEQQLRQAKDWLKELQQHLSVAVNVVQNLVGHLNAVSDDFYDMARSLSHMARYEEGLAQRQGQYTPSGSSAAQRAADLQLLGYASMRQQAVDKQFVLRTGASLVFLHDWWVLIPEAVAALEEREDAFDALQMLQEELQDKQQQAAAAAANGDRRMTQFHAAAQALQDKLACATEQYDVLKERNQTELVRISLQRAVDFRMALKRFAQVQLQLAQACSSVWSGVVDQLLHDTA